VSAAVAERLEVGGASTGQALVLRCAWCERVKVGGAWIAAADERMPESIEERSDGICPDCHAKLTPHAPL
jgi:hypothetical protein